MKAKATVVYTASHTDSIETAQFEYIKNWWDESLSIEYPALTNYRVNGFLHCPGRKCTSLGL